MANSCARWRFALGLLAMYAATGQTQTITGSIVNVGLPNGSTRPLAMKTAQLPATVVIVANGYALSTMGVSNLDATVLAGSPIESGYYDAVGNSARFAAIADLALTSDGRVAYVADEFNSCIRMVNIPSGAVSTFVGSNVSGDAVGSLQVVRLTMPSAVTLSPNGAYLYIADRITYRIVQVDIFGSMASYVSIANWNNAPIGLTMGPDQSKLFVSTSTNGIFQLNLQTSTSTHLDLAAQNGQCLSVAGNGRYLFVTDATWNAVRVIDLTFGGSRWICSPTNQPQSGTQQVFGNLETCLLGHPVGITAVSSNSLYISDMAKANIMVLTYNGNFALTTVPTTTPTTKASTPAPTIGIPPVFTPKALPTTTTLTPTFAPPSNSTAGNQNGMAAGASGASLDLALGVGIGVAFVVVLAFGLCIFFAIRDYRKNKRNPTTPFSRAVSFAVRSFRSSFGRGRFQRNGRQPLAESTSSFVDIGLTGRTAATPAAAAANDGAQQRRQQQPPLQAASAPRPAGAGAHPPDGGSRGLGTNQRAPAAQQPGSARNGAGGPGAQQRFQPPTIYEVPGPQAEAGRDYESLKVKGPRPESQPVSTSAGRGGRAPDRGMPYGVAQPTSPSSQAGAAHSAPQWPRQAAQGQRYYDDPLDAGGVYGQRNTSAVSAEARPTSGPQRSSQPRDGSAGPYGPADLASSSYRSSGGVAAAAGAGSGELVLNPARLGSTLAAGPVVSNPAYGYPANPAGNARRPASGSPGEPPGDAAHSVNV